MRLTLVVFHVKMHWIYRSDTMKKAAFFTLGCKVNQYETNAMEKLFTDAGYQIVPFETAADVYVVNTCTVTSISDKKSRNMLRRAKSYNPNAVVAAVGCLAQTAPDEVEKIDCVDVIVGTNQKNNIVEACEKAMREKKRVSLFCDVSNTDYFEDMPLDFFDSRQRAYIKIQEGCDRFCSYCIIPYARGTVRSRDEGSILNEAKRLGRNNFPEIVLTGIHVSSYGRDTGTGLGELIKKIAEIDEIKRIRLSSIDPTAFDDDFIRILSEEEKVCRHFHISLQSGSATVLRKMNRHYTPHFYMSVLNKLRAAMPDVAITTDVIMGFPYETEEDFEKSLNFVKEAGFLNVHVFPYSERKGTPAAKFAESVPKAVRKERAQKMAEAASFLKHKFMEQFIGKKAEVLFEEKNKNGFFEGFTSNYIKVIVSSDKRITGKILPVKLTGIKDDMMTAGIL